MDYNKIGKFIANERKERKLTQAKLAEKLYVSEKTISKWENGNGIPDANSLCKLSEIFDLTINELLNGEKITDDNYTSKAENTIMELRKAKEESDKRLLLIEVVLGTISVISFLAILFMSMYAIKELDILVLPIILIVLDVIMFLVSILFCLYIEQKAGYYICKKCNHKFVPTYKQVNLAMHIGRTRYIKCPNCHKKSWHRKVTK